MLHRRKESELSLSACMLCADGQPLRGCPSQNDVKFKQTNAVKVLVKLFQKLAGSKGRALGVLPYKVQFECQHPFVLLKMLKA